MTTRAQIPGRLAVLAALCACACLALAQTAPAKPAPGPAPAFAWSLPQADISALILAAEESTLSSQMSGRIKQIHVGLGESFKKGARLLEFDCSEQQAQLDSAEAELRAARETHLARLRLHALGAAGELEVTVAAATADKARSQVTFRASQLAYCKVDAPFGGNVARLRVKPAESVPVGHQLIDIVNPASLKAQMFVPASWVSKLRIGMALSIHVGETGRSFAARISRMNARVDGVSQQLELEARIERPNGRLLPGMVGVAVFEPPQAAAPRR
ncbi:MAG: efflux RND transporter periplasmic adaptor subunit [Betaproteobacteria bacterium]